MHVTCIVATLNQQQAILAKSVVEDSRVTGPQITVYCGKYNLSTTVNSEKYYILRLLEPERPSNSTYVNKLQCVVTDILA